MLLICECTLFFWLFCPSCRRYQGTAFLLLRGARKKISTGPGTITVPSLSISCSPGPTVSIPGEFRPLFCRRFEQSGIKCRPLLTLWASAAVASRDWTLCFRRLPSLGLGALLKLEGPGRGISLRSIFGQPDWIQRG